MLSRIASLLKVQAPTPYVTGLLRAYGTTVPSNGTAGYETGCLFAHTDGGAGTAVYVNEGTVASCAFRLIGDTLKATTLVQAQGNPTDLVDTAVTLTIAQLLSKIIVATPTANRQQVLPTGTLMSGGKDIAIGESFDWSVINLAAATYTETVAAGTDHTIVGSGVVNPATAGTFRSRKTAATTWIMYRVA